MLITVGQEHTADGDDYQWFDNHGELIRCKDCKHNETEPDAGNALCKRFYGAHDQYGSAIKGSEEMPVLNQEIDKDQIIKDYKEGATFAMLTKKHRLGYYRLRNILLSEGIEIRHGRNKWNEKRVTKMEHGPSKKCLLIKYFQENDYKTIYDIDCTKLAEKFSCSKDYVSGIMYQYSCSIRPQRSLDDFCITKKKLWMFKQSVFIGDRFMIPVTTHPDAIHVRRSMLEAIITGIYPNFVQTDKGSVLWGDLYKYERIGHAETEVV